MPGGCRTAYPGSLADDHGRPVPRGGVRLQPPAEVGDVGLQGTDRVARWVLAPDGVDQPLGRHDLTPCQEQDRQDGALTTPAQLERGAVVRRSQLAEQVDP